MNNIETKLQEIASLREIKGRESDTLTMINALEPEVIASGDFTPLCHLYWERAFVYQHLVMSNIDVDANLQLMEEAAQKAHQLVTEHQLNELVGDDTRFLGRVYDSKKDYPQAEVYYRQALTFYEPTNHPRVLEIKGFLSANLVNQGKVEEGLALAKHTYTDFDQNTLKQSDYYKWAVWKTGIYPRIIKALVSQQAVFNHAEMISLLDESRLLLTNPQGDVTWGDKSFQFRLDEIDEAKKLL
jgi:hypothetical protein